MRGCVKIFKYAFFGRTTFKYGTRDQKVRKMASWGQRQIYVSLLGSNLKWLKHYQNANSYSLVLFHLLSNIGFPFFLSRLVWSTGPDLGSLASSSVINQTQHRLNTSLIHFWKIFRQTFRKMNTKIWLLYRQNIYWCCLQVGGTQSI